VCVAAVAVGLQGVPVSAQEVEGPPSRERPKVEPGKPLDPSIDLGQRALPVPEVPPSEPTKADFEGAPRPIDVRPFAGDVEPRPAWAASLRKPDGGSAGPQARGVGNLLKDVPVDRKAAKVGDRLVDRNGKEVLTDEIKAAYKLPGASLNVGRGKLLGPKEAKQQDKLRVADGAKEVQSVVADEDLSVELPELRGPASKT
jgi:hypothetical protein